MAVWKEVSNVKEGKMFFFWVQAQQSFEPRTGPLCLLYSLQKGRRSLSTEIVQVRSNEALPPLFWLLPMFFFLQQCLHPMFGNSFAKRLLLWVLSDSTACPDMQTHAQLRPTAAAEAPFCLRLRAIEYQRLRVGQWNPKAS